MKRFLEQCYRLRTEILFMVGALVGLYFTGLETVNLRALLYKLLLITVAVLYAHISRKMIYSYIDLGNYVDGGSKEPATVRGAVILGVFLLQGAIIIAFMTGL